MSRELLVSSQMTQMTEDKWDSQNFGSQTPKTHMDLKEIALIS